jgi:hypothetical protein
MPLPTPAATDLVLHPLRVPVNQLLLNHLWNNVVHGTHAGLQLPLNPQPSQHTKQCPSEVDCLEAAVECITDILH